MTKASVILGFGEGSITGSRSLDASYEDREEPVGTFTRSATANISLVEQTSAELHMCSSSPMNIFSR